MNSKLLALALFSLLTGFLQLPAQNLSVVRMEIPAALEVEALHVEPLDVFGVLLFSESNEVNEDGLRKWYFALFDKSVKQQWLKFVPLPDKIEFISSRRAGNKLYLLFKNLSGPRLDKGYYEVVIYDVKAQTFSNISGNLPLKAKIAGFEVIGNTACIGLNLRKNETDVLFVDLNNGDIQPVHLREGTQNHIESILSDSWRKNFYVVLKTMKDKRYLSDEIIVFNRSGQKLKTLEIQNKENLKVLRSFILLPGKHEHLKLMGTYDLVIGKNITVDDLRKESPDPKGAGMFYLEFKSDTLHTLHFYDFLSFDNIYGSLAGRRMDYSRNKADVDNPEHKKSLSALFHFSNPRVMKKDKQYVFTVELYRASYHAETRMDYDYYGRPVPYTYNVFDGYSFYDVIIAGLSEDGKLIWNNDFPIYNVKTFSLSPKVEVFEDGDYITLAYVTEGKIHSQTIEGPADIAREESAIETNFIKDRIAQDNNNRIVHWYGDYFLIYGYQRLKNRTLEDQSVRTVFYVNKVAYK